MEEETITTSPEYLKGFNEGYLIAKENPELSQKLSSVKSESDRTKGFLAGQKEYLIEKVKDKIPYFNRDTPSKDIEKSRGKDKGLDIVR